MRRAIFVVVLCAVFLGLGMMGFKKLASQAEDSKRSATPPEPAMVRSMTLTRTSYDETLRGYGRARALRRTTVAAEVAGYVTAVDPKIESGNAIEFTLPSGTNGGSDEADGDAKKEAPRPGPVVVQLEEYELKDRLKKAKAELATTEADIKWLTDAAVNLAERLDLAEKDLKTAKRERDRVAGLVREGGRFSPSQLDAEELKVSLQSRSVLQLKQQLTDNTNQQKVTAKRKISRQADVAIAERNLRRAKVRVPYPGVIESRSVNAGDRVGPGQALFVLLDLSKVEIPIALPARYFADVKVGSAVTLYHAESGREVHTGSVTRKSPSINEAERVFYAYVVVEGTATKNAIAPGEYFRGEVAGRRHSDVFVVPREAFAGVDLFVITRDPEAEATDGARRVIAKRVKPTVARWLVDVAVVSGGVKSGDEIATTNLESVGNGTKLRVAAPVDAQGEAGR